MNRFDQQMREVERSIAGLTGNKTQATKIRNRPGKENPAGGGEECTQDS